MLEELSIQLRGGNYSLEILDHSSGASSTKWCWFDSDGMAAPSRLTQELNQVFIQQWTAEKIAALEPRDAIGLRTLLLEMGVPEALLREVGLIERTAEEIEEDLRELRFAILPDAGHGLSNCTHLLKWAVAEKHSDINIAFCFIGDGPFPKDELLNIALSSNVFCYQHEEQFTPSLVSFITRTSKVPSFFSHYFVVGREGWSEEEIDRLIDDNVGQLLKFYSQEMLASYLITGRDPFEGDSDVLTAFRVGHPALEYLSQGWPGWVTSIVAPDRGRTGDRWYPEISRQTGLLKYMGYTVGVNGLPDTERRRILADAFARDLSEFESISDKSYLLEWGEPSTAKRLHKIAESIAAFCRSMRSRSNASPQAVADWDADLNWLKQNFYKGAMTFSWPQTIVWQR